MALPDLTPRLFNRLILGAVLTGFVALLGVAATATWLVNRNQDFAEWVAHTYEVEERISGARVTFERAEASSRGYLLNRDGYYLQTYIAASRSLPATVDGLATLVADNPPQQQRALRLADAIDQQKRRLDRLVELARQGRVAEARAAFGGETERDELIRARSLLTEMRQVEQRLLHSRQDQLEQNRRLLLGVLTLAAVILVLVGGGSLLVIRRYAGDLNASRNDLRRLNLGLEDAVTARTSDLARANDEIQRFAYIVSHDLRAPLVNVMGFTAELDGAVPALQALVATAEREAPDIVTDDARLAAREDLPEAIGFIRSSTQKMDRLINAILALSRQGRRVLAPVRIETAGLVGTVADSLATLAERQGARIDVDEDLPAVTSDRLALEQVFSNLLENALKYAQPGRPALIAVTGRRQNGRVLFDVRDNGRGIDPKDHQRVFDLFRRAGQQDQAGEGIGLANVRALVYRLGGLITVRSSLGEGSTFTVDLPPVLTAAKAAQSEDINA